MTARSATEAHALIGRNGVELIVICPNWAVEKQFYGGVSGDGYSLYGALSSGSAPSFLEEVRLPGDLERRFRLYSVVDPS